MQTWDARFKIPGELGEIQAQIQTRVKNHKLREQELRDTQTRIREINLKLRFTQSVTWNQILGFETLSWEIKNSKLTRNLQQELRIRANPEIQKNL